MVSIVKSRERERERERESRGRNVILVLDLAAEAGVDKACAIISGLDYIFEMSSMYTDNAAYMTPGRLGCSELIFLTYFLRHQYIFQEYLTITCMHQPFSLFLAAIIKIRYSNEKHL